MCVEYPLQMHVAKRPLVNLHIVDSSWINTNCGTNSSCPS